MNLTHLLPWSLLLLVQSAISAPSRTCRERSIKHRARCEDNALLQLLNPTDQPDTNRKLAESFCASYFASPAILRPVQTPEGTTPLTTMTPPPAVSPMPVAKPPVVRLGAHHLFEDDSVDDVEPQMTTITVTITTTRTITRTTIPTKTVTTTKAPSITARSLHRLGRRRRVIARAPPLMEHCPQPWRGQPEDEIRRACECLIGTREKGTAVRVRAEESTAVMTAPVPAPDVSSFSR